MSDNKMLHGQDQVTRRFYKDVEQGFNYVSKKPIEANQHFSQLAMNALRITAHQDGYADGCEKVLSIIERILEGDPHDASSPTPEEFSKEVRRYINSIREHQATVKGIPF